MSDQRGDKEEWCLCNHCKNMDIPRERVCCHDIRACLDKLPDAITRYEQFGPFNCISQHPGFIRNCTLPEVLDNAWLSFRQHYGPNAYNDNGNANRRYRHIAYRQLARFLFGVVGKDNRFCLPSCCVTIIRETFPDVNNTYTGFLFSDE